MRATGQGAPTTAKVGEIKGAAAGFVLAAAFFLPAPAHGTGLRPATTAFSELRPPLQKERQERLLPERWGDPIPTRPVTGGDDLAADVDIRSVVPSF